MDIRMPRILRLLEMCLMHNNFPTHLNQAPQKDRDPGPVATHVPGAIRGREAVSLSEDRALNVWQVQTIWEESGLLTGDGHYSTHQREQ